MAQYRVGSVDATNGSAVVVGHGTEWLTEVEVGQRITLGVDGVWYEVDTVDADDQLTLTTEFDGETAENLAYAVHRDYTGGIGFPTFSFGDIQTGSLLAETMALIDAQMAQLGAGAGSLEGTRESTFTVRIDFEGVPADDGGIIVERGDLANASFLFKDSQANKRWELGGDNLGEVGELHVSGKVGIGQEPGDEALEITGNVVITGTYNGYTPLDAATYTAADILAKLLTVDGNASGLDADTVRGTTPSTHGRALLASAGSAGSRTLLELGTAAVEDAGFFAPAVHYHDDRYFTETEVTAALALKADVTSPTLLGTPAAPTAAAATNTTQIATTAFVHEAIDNLLGGAPGALDTLAELAAALDDDADFAANVTTAIGTKLNASAVSSFSLTVLDDTTATAWRSTLELGTAALASADDFAEAVHTHTDGIHNNVASEIHSITEKASLAPDDEFLIEDSAAAWIKKRVKASKLPPGIAEFRFVYDDSVSTSTDPGSNNLRLNNLTPGSVTAIGISDVDAFGANVEAAIISWGIGGSTLQRGHVLIRKVGASDVYFFGSITGSVTNSAGWCQFTILYVDHNGAFTDGDLLDITFHRTGATGATGANAMIGPVWNFETTAGGTPGANSFRFDDAPASATELIIQDASLATGGSIDVGVLLGNAAIGDLLIFRGHTTASQFVQVEISGTPVDNGGTWTVPITVITAGSTALANGNDLSMQWFPRGLQGIKGDTGDQGLPGEMSGPEGAVDLRIAVFDGISGVLVADGGKTIAEVLDRANHTGAQAISTITGLQDILDNMAADAIDITFEPAGAIAATTVQAAIEELDTETVKLTGSQTVAGVKTFDSAPIVPDASFGLAKIANIATARLLGRTSASAGPVEELGAATARTLLSIDNLDNTADLDKPVSTATATAISDAIDALVGGAPGALDTLNELAAALADDASYAASVTTALAGKAPISVVDNVVELYNFNNGKIDKSTLDANSILMATTDNTPIALAVAASRIIGRKASGDIGALTAAEAKTVLALENVDNTSDASKPVSTAQQTALDGKENADADILRGDVEGQGPATGGIGITPKDLGNSSGAGTITPDPRNRGIQKITNNGAFTLAPGSDYGAYILDIIIASGAGTITVTGWDVIDGPPFTTTNGHKFRCHCCVTADLSTLTIQAGQ